MQRGRFLQVVAFVFALPASVGAQSEPTPVHTACSSAYEKAQEERSRGHLQAARVELQGCVQAQCPEFMQADCSNWLGQIDAALPSLVFAVRNRGEDIREVRVRMDGMPLLQTLDGASIVVDPGMHTFEFYIPGRPEPVAKKLLVLEGEKNRILVIELTELPAVVAPAPRKRVVKREPTSSSFPRPMEILPYALLGVGALGVAGFSVLGLQGNTREAELEHSCAPNCSDDELDDVRTKWLLADISLGVGLVALGTGTYLLLAEPSKESARAKQERSAPRFGFAVHPGGAFTSLGSSF